MNNWYRDQHGSLEQEIVLGKDERFPVKNTRQAPFRWICSIEVEFPEPVLYPLGTLEHPGKNWATLTPSRKGCGSGLLITPGHVLTNSHVIAGLKVEKRAGQRSFRLIKASKVRVIPGRNISDPSRTEPFGRFTAEKISVSPGFRKSVEGPVDRLTKAQVRRALSADFGLIHLDLGATGQGKPILPGWWSEQAIFQIRPTEEVLVGGAPLPEVHISGYPGDKGRAPCTTPWSSRGAAQLIAPKNARKENLLFYRADTAAGMSGSPVWIIGNDGRYYLVAVHSSFLKIKRKGKLETFNVGVRLSKAVIWQLHQWGATYQEVIFSKPLRY